jgi:phage-related protein
MPVVGDATIIVRAITDKVKGDITKGLKGLDKVGSQYGDQFGDSFTQSFGDRLDKDLAPALDRAFSNASDMATSAGQNSSRNFASGFAGVAAVELSDALTRSFDGVDSNSVGHRIGADLNLGIMAGLGDKDKEIADLLGGIDLSGFRDQIGNQVAEAVIPAFRDAGYEGGRDLVNEARRGVNDEGGGDGLLGGLLSGGISNVGTELGNRLATDTRDSFNRNMDGSGLDLGRGLNLDADSRRRINSQFLALQSDVRQRFNPIVDSMSNSLNRLFTIGDGGGGGGGMLSARFSNWARDARAASKSFTMLYGIGQLIGPAISVVIGAVSSLLTGVVELGAAIAEAIPAGVAVAASSMATLVQAFATVKIAGIGFAKNFKLGLQAAQIGEQKGFGSPEYIAANEKYLASLKTLSPEAQSFTKYLISLRKEGIKLRNAAGKGLFPALESSVKRLNKALFPSLLKVLESTGKALGTVATSVSKAMSTDRFVKNFGIVAKNNNEIIKISGKVFANLIDIVNTLLVAMGPVTLRFAKWIESLTGAWRESVNAKGAMGKLKDMFEKSGDIAAQLGRIFGNIGRGLFNLGQAAAPAGEKLLKAFEGATKKFEEFTASLENNPKAAKFFDDVANNVIKIGRLFNTLVLEFAKLGDSPAIGKTADSLSEFTPILGDILDRLTDAGPQLGSLLTSLAETMKLLTDSKSVQVFLETLKLILDGFNTILGSEFGQKFLIMFGPIFAVHRALAFAWRGINFILLAMSGGFLNLGKIVGGVGKAIQWTILRLIVPAFQALFAILGVSNPVGWVVVAIAALTALGVWLYRHNETFKAWVDGIWSAIKDAGKPIIDFFKTLWDTVKAGWQGLVTAVQPVVDKFKEIWSSIAGAVSTAFNTIMTILQPFITFFIGYWSIVINIVKGAISIFLAIFQPLLGILVSWWQLLGGIFIAGAKTMWSIFKTLADFIWGVVTMLFGALKTLFQTIFAILYIPIKVAIGLTILAFQWLRDRVGGTLSGLLSAAKAVWNALVLVFGPPIKAALDVVKVAFEAVSTAIRIVLNGLADWIRPKIQAIADVFRVVFGSIKTVVAGIFDAIKRKIEGTISKIKTGINGFIGIINGLISGVNKVSGVLNKLPGPDIPKISEIPKLASGGIVKPKTGGTLALLAEAGKSERVEPLDNSGMSARDRLILDAIKNSTGKEVHVTVNNYYPEPERASENLAMSMRVAREHMAGV